MFPNREQQIRAIYPDIEKKALTEMAGKQKKEFAIL
jgi:hypothetical protein